jgi:hypothetical protein
MRKKCQVVMLPTEKASKLALCKLDERKGLFYGETPSIEDDLTNQHLYLISSDDKPKFGDYCYYPGLNQVMIFDKDEIWDKDKCKKAIASTDSHLHVRDNSVYVDGKTEEILMEFHVPDLPESFIKAYVKAGGIDEVMVEYETAGNWVQHKTSERIGQICTICNEYEYGGLSECNCGFKLKLRDDNTVIISQIKEKTYTKEELQEIMLNFSHYINDKNETTIIKGATIQRWIENNL